MSRNVPRPIKQACAIPYRVRDGKLEFCLITSSGKGHWGFPKGIIDPGETPPETALKEALEEAGLVGKIEGRVLGQYTYSKWGTRLKVSVYLMRVTRAKREWLEADMRQRRWCGVKEASQRIERKELCELLETALVKLRRRKKTLPGSSRPVPKPSQATG